MRLRVILQLGLSVDCSTELGDDVMSDFEKVAKISDVPEGEVGSFFASGEPIAICRVAGNFYAFKDECTHQALPLSGGDLNGDSITCCYHGAEFNVKTGKVLCPPASEPLETYEVKVEGEDIFVKIDC